LPRPPPALPPFPTRRSSDLDGGGRSATVTGPMPPPPRPPAAPLITRRSTLAFGVLLFVALVAASMLYGASGSGSMRGSGALGVRSEEHTSELQSRGHLVCRL